jgi:hypothetical protein
MPCSPTEAFAFLLQETVTQTVPHDSGSERPHSSQFSFLEDFRRSRIIPLYHRHQFARKTPFTLCFVGLTNVGKSTLIEAILGEAVAPVLNGPATAVPVEYSRDHEWKLEVFYHSAETRPTLACFDSSHAMAADIRKRVIGLTEEQAAKIAVVCIKGPFSALEGDLVLADTPGFGAARLSPKVVEPTDDWRARTIRNAGRAYLCVGAGASWHVSPEEQDFYRGVSHLCANVIVTKWEGTEADKIEWLSTFERLFPGADFDFVNAKRALNVERIQSIVRSQATDMARVAQLHSELVKAWNDLHAHFANTFKTPIPWRRDSLSRFGAACLQFPELEPIARKSHLSP